MRFTHKLFESTELERVEVDGQRFYRVPSGGLYQSVTTALGAINAKAIQQWRNRVGAEEAQRIATRASTRGTYVHAICENYLGNVEQYLKRDGGKKAFMPVHVEMFNQIKPHLDSYVDEVYGIETRMYSDELKLAGTCDCICRMHGVPAIVDFKTATKPKEKDKITNYFLQAAAYSIMVKERYNKLISNIGIIIATEHDGLQTFWEPVRPYEEMMREFMATGKLPRPKKY